MMRLLPYNKFTLTTKLSPTDVTKRLHENVEPKSYSLLSRRPSSTKPYEGKMQAASFTISRIINHRNSFLPIITGKLTDQISHTEIVVTMRPHTFVLVFMVFWLGIVGIACLTILFVAVNNLKIIITHRGSLPLLIPFAMFFFGYALLLFGYRPEAKKAKTFLMELLQAEEQK